MNDARVNKLMREDPAVMAIVRKIVASLPAPIVRVPEVLIAKGGKR